MTCNMIREVVAEAGDARMSQLAANFEMTSCREFSKSTGELALYTGSVDAAFALSLFPEQLLLCWWCSRSLCTVFWPSANLLLCPLRSGINFLSRKLRKELRRRGFCSLALPLNSANKFAHARGTCFRVLFHFFSGQLVA
jgi:hypothetical protein